MPEDEAKWPAGKVMLPRSEWTVERLQKTDNLYAGNESDVRRKMDELAEHVNPEYFNYNNGGDLGLMPLETIKEQVRLFGEKSCRIIASRRQNTSETGMTWRRSKGGSRLRRFFPWSARQDEQCGARMEPGAHCFTAGYGAWSRLRALCSGRVLCFCDPGLSNLIKIGVEISYILTSARWVLSKRITKG